MAFHTHYSFLTNNIPDPNQGQTIATGLNTFHPLPRMEHVTISYTQQHLEFRQKK